MAKRESFWSEFKKVGREMYQIPKGTSAVKFLASLPVDAVKYVKGEAVSAAYSAKRTRALQDVMDYQFGGRDAAHTEELKRKAHQALTDFPEIRKWIDPNVIR